MFKNIADVFRSFDSDITEKFLELLLNAMKIAFDFNRDYRKNIEGFKGRYLFKSRDNSITVSAVFGDNRLRVDDKDIHDTDVTVTFRDSKALRDYILSPKPDILGSILRQDVVIDGNFNYLYKFAYMAKHLQLMATGKL
jgi:hypothetical protein